MAKLQAKPFSILDGMTQAEARKYLRKILGPDTRELEGEEHDHTWLILQFMEPFDSSNNQRTCTDKYKIGDIEYHVHFGIYKDRPMIEVVLEDDE